MKFDTIRLMLACLLFCAAANTNALTVPFTEDFEAGTASWLDGLSAPTTLNGPTGGADGGQYISNTSDVADTLGIGGQTIFRCHASDVCSGGAFVGDWASNVGTLSWDIRHDAGSDLTFFVRIATPGNFPAWIGSSTVSVAPNTWTTVSIGIDPSNPLLFPEFGDFVTTFGNVGNLQIGVGIPTGFTATGVTFDLDQVAIAAVPLPAAVWLLAPLVPLLGRARRSTVSG